MIPESALALLKYMVPPLHTLHVFKAKEEPSNISRVNYLNQLGWGFPKWQMISAWILVSYLGTNSFLTLFPQCYISIMHKTQNFFTAVMLVLCGMRKVQWLWITRVLWGSLAFTVCLSWDGLALLSSYFLSNLSTLTMFYIICFLVTLDILPSQWFNGLQ